MKRNWKRNAAVCAMLVLVGAAAFVNWRFTGDAAAQTGAKVLGQSTLVSGGDEAPQTDEAAVYSGSDYFASARLTRQQARDSAIELLQQAADEENADVGVANEASAGIQVLAAYTLTEAQIENLVTAKGYTDCVAFMGENSVSVVVARESGELTGEDVARITDITMTETGYPASTIKIVAAK